MKHIKKPFFLIISILIISSFICAEQNILAVSQIVEKYGKAIVLIATVKGEEGTIGLGSGFIVNPSGVIITNYHVIKGAYPVVVKLVNGDIYDDISIINTDERRDIAIIKVKAWSLPIVNLGNSDSVKVGEQVVVIGNPRGLENSVTDGLISAIRDSGQGYKMHQISAPISPGSSGSPVFTMRGEVVGIATSSLVEGQNLNFSLPINYARGLIDGEVKMSLEEFFKNSAVKTPYPKKEINNIGLSEIDIKVREIKELIIQIQNERPIGFRNFTICSAIHGFGAYVPLPNSIIKAKGTLLVYYEPTNIFTKQLDGKFEIWYTQDMTLLSEKGVVIQEWPNILDFHYSARSLVLDLFAQNTLSLEGKVPRGKYKFKVVLKDMLKGESAIKIVDFEVR